MLKRTLLLPDENIWLHHDEPADVFIGIFQECWKRLPDSDRTRMLAYWKSSGIETWPMIELSTLWSDSKSCFGQVRGRGMEVRYNSASFQIFPRGMAQWFIAHELAHVFQKAEGKRPGGDEESRNEDDADCIVERWGFCRSAYTFFQIQRSQGASVEDSCNCVKKLFNE